nr:hypothetical protein [Tanacetum cinerariifolium]
MDYEVAPQVGAGSRTSTEPHHTPSHKAQQSSHHDLSPSIHPTTSTEPIPTTTPTKIPILRQYSRRAIRIAQSNALFTIVDELASLLRDDSQGEAFPTVFGLEARQDRENIIKTSALPHNSTPRVTSLDADEGSMQQQLQELTDLCTCLQRQQTKMALKINAHDLEISNLKARIKLLEDKDKGNAELSGDDASIKRRSLETGEEAGVERSIKRGSNYTEEMVNVLTFIDAANILTSGVADVSVPPAAEVSTVGILVFNNFDEGYVSFGQGGCKITGKGTIKTECIVLGRNFKITDDTNVLLRTPRQHNMYSIDLNNVVPHKYLTCLVAKASIDECMLWHRRLGHLNFKIMNKLVRHNLVRGLPSKCFENDHTYVTCLKGKQHKASCKTKLVNSVTKPLHTLHMDLFGPTSDETSDILRNFITKIENLKDLKVKIIRCDNGGEFRNKEMNDFCSKKGIKKEFSNARTSHQNGIAKRRNKTLIEAARTMLADAKLPVTFWAEAVNTAYYFQNRVLVNKSQNKTPYELFNRKFEAKGDEGYFIGYSMSSKAFRVFNKRTKRVEENLHVDFLENKLIEKEAGPNWLFDIDTLTNSMNYVPVVSAGTTSTNFSVETLIPTVTSPVPTACLNDSLQLSSDSRLISKKVTSQDDTPSLDNILTLTNRFKDILRVTTSSGDTNGVEADLRNMENNISASPNPTLRIHKDHLKRFTVYQMDVQSAFLYGTIDEEVYVMQPPGFQDPEFPARVYKVEKAMYGLHQAPRAWYGLQVLQKKDDIFLSQDKYVGDILKKFGYLDARSANTPMDKENPWGKDETGKDVDLHLYRSMIGSVMYLTASRPDIMFVVCACARHQTIMATSTTKVEYVAAASGCGQVLWIQNQLLDYGYNFIHHLIRDCFEKKLISVDHIHTDDNVADLLTKPFDAGSNMARLAFCDYHNMIAILEKYEHNADFHQIVDFVEASHLRYDLTINPTVYVSHIRQFWSTARVETSDEETKILATVDGKPRTISESSIRRNIKLKDEAGISSLPNAELFKNLTLMGVNSPSFSGRTVPLFPTMLVTMGEASGTLTEPHHTPSPEAPQSPQHDLLSSIHLPVSTTTIPTVIPTKTPPLRQYSRRARIAQSLALPTVADEPASPLGDDNQGEACPTVSGFEAEQDRANIIKTSTLPSDSTPRQDEMVSKIIAQDLEISTLKAMIKLLKDKDGGGNGPSRKDTTIKGRSLETGEKAGIERSTNKGSNDTEEMVNVLTSLDAVSILTSRVQVSVPLAVEVATVSIPPAGEIPTVSIPTGSGVVPTASPILTTATVATPYSKRKDNYAKVLKYQSQQRKPLSKKQQREFYMSVLRSHAGWKTKNFKGMSLEEIREKFVLVWKQIEDFVPIGSKSKGERFKRKGLRLEHDSPKKVKTLEEVSEEDLKTMMQLVPVEEVELKRLYEPDVEDQLWTHTQALIHDLVEWRLYDSCGVHHVLSGDQVIFLLVERDYPLRKGIAIVMIRNKLQVENYSQMENDLILKIHQIANSPRPRGIPTASDEFQLPEDFPTASEGSKMTTLAEHIIVAGAENHPPMLEKSMYDSWESHIRLFIKGNKNCRMMLDSIDNGLLVYPTVEENWQTWPKKYSELTEAQQLQDDFDVQATNISLHGLPPDVYAHVNHQEAAKGIWNRVKLLMKGTELSYQEVNEDCTTCLISLSPIHHQHHHTPVNPQQQSVSLQPFISPPVTQESQVKFPQLDSGLAVPTFQQPFKMDESQFNKFKEDKLRVLLAQETEELLQPQGETMQLQTIPQNSAFQTKDLDVCDSDCDDISSAKVVMMETLSSYDSDVLSEDTNSSTPNDLLVLSLVEQITDHVANLDKENHTNKMVNESLAAELERYKERVIIFKQRQNEIDTLKETLSNQVKEKESLSTTLTAFKIEYKEKESKYMDKETLLENKNKELENTLFHQIKPTLYDGSVIAKEHDGISVIDDEETLILEEESRSKMIDKKMIQFQ